MTKGKIRSPETGSRDSRVLQPRPAPPKLGESDTGKLPWGRRHSALTGKGGKGKRANSKPLLQRLYLVYKRLSPHFQAEPLALDYIWGPKTKVPWSLNSTAHS